MVTLENMTTERKLWILNITPEAALCYDGKNWIINKRGAPKLEAAQIRNLEILQ